LKASAKCAGKPCTPWPLGGTVTGAGPFKKKSIESCVTVYERISVMFLEEKGST
jgi:hypothetical protein